MKNFTNSLILKHYWVKEGILDFSYICIVYLYDKGKMLPESEKKLLHIIEVLKYFVKNFSDLA